MNLASLLLVFMRGIVRTVWLSGLNILPQNWQQESDGDAFIPENNIFQLKIKRGYFNLTAGSMGSLSYIYREDLCNNYMHSEIAEDVWKV